MPSFNISNPIASEVQAVSFDSLSTKDILAISVKQIVNPNTFDSNGNPRDGGLYDSALGPFIKSIACSTCNLSGDNCPGHVGHILLPTPVYHPVFFDQMLRLLRSTCVYCHKLRMPSAEVNRYVCKLQLIQNGLLDEAMQVDEFQSSSVKDSTKDDNGDMSDGEDDAVDALMRKREKFVRAALKKLKEMGPPTKTNSILEVRRELVHGFMKAITTGKKCHNCKGISPVFRKDGFSKLFERPLSPRDLLAMTQLGFKRSTLTQDIRSRATAVKPKDAQAEDSTATMVEDHVEGAQRMAVDSKAGRIMTAIEVHYHLSHLFERESAIMNLIYQTTVDRRFHSKMARKVTADMFFLHAIAVPPTPFRAPTVTGKELNENTQNTSLKKIMESCLKIRDINDEVGPESAAQPGILYGRLVREFITLQDEVNSFVDSTKTTGPNRALAAASAIGIKQILEKKEGLFRMNMMGKRVNFAARSVISPDPNIETSEIGVPLVFARKLTYPEPVTPHNIEVMRQAVINGPENWPGATHIEYENGRLQKLPLSLDSRKALANSLLTPSDATSKSLNKKVYRHVQDGDMVLMNRQPTLHKPSIMGHKVRVLKKENTIRMHYANCNTYNADFDGDEMNMHLPQNENARAEAQLVANTDSQYLVATSGKPLRGLIQDHIVMGVYMTKRDTFFSKGEFQQLLYACLRPEDDHTVRDRIELLQPAILKPRKMWTGKQVISCILSNIRPSGYNGLSLESKSQTPGSQWGEDSEEGQVIFHNGDLVCGILDKSQFGASAFGLVHSVYEVYGNETAGKLLSILGRLFTKFLHMRAFTCGMDDLLLTSAGNKARRSLIVDAEGTGREVAAKYVGLEGIVQSESEAQLRSRLEEVLRDDAKQGNLDGVMNSRTRTLTSEIIRETLPRGLIKSFPRNQMQAMTISGAKGSDVNASQISCLLGQQVLEGRRVPVMVSGKTLPSFKPYDTRTRAGGYITDRFLTGIRPQEYYFHAMAGREGLIDTAVKTSRSGYLQRCLIKGMEGMTVQYDNSVRDSDGSLVQFLYGEDSLDVTKQKHLKDFKFHALNAVSFIKKLKIQAVSPLLDATTAAEYQKSIMKKLKRPHPFMIGDPAMSVYSPGKYVGSVSEKFTEDLEMYVKANPDNLIGKNHLKKTPFRALMNYKYMNSVIEPGEAVGLLAGQSVGEPSTQMTLNTFHLAGHSAKNVTLGIPRLREIVMTATATISTPNMTLLLQDDASDDVAESFARRVSKVTLAEVVEKAVVTESIATGIAHTQAKIYKIRLEFFPQSDYKLEYQISQEDLLATIEGEFLAKLTREISKSHQKAGESISDAKPVVGTAKLIPSKGPVAMEVDAGGDEEADEGDSDNDEAEGEARARLRKKQAVSYEDPDASEEDVVREDENHDDDDDDDVPDSDTDMPMEDIIPESQHTEEPLSKSPKKKSVKKTSPKAREIYVKSIHKDVMTFAFDDMDGRWCDIELEYSVGVAKLLMISLVEKACKMTVVHQLAGIKKCYRIEDDTSDRANPKRQLSTDGVNFHAMWDYEDIIKTNEIYTNDIVAMLNVYGVEAARSTIVREMSSVFTGHGIQVDVRHLNLIADIMTRAGGFSPFNRIGLKSDVSPFLKMSFETTTQFLKEAALEGDHDDLKSPSARIVLGRLSKVGTGCFEILTST